MPRKDDLRQVDAVCSEARMTPDQERRFRRWLHLLKASGNGGTANDRGDFTWSELVAAAQEFLAEES